MRPFGFFPSALVVLLAACGPPAPASPPSILLVSIDTLRADHLGLYGYERDTSPFLDRWSREALVFERAFTPLAWTLIAHMTLLTGLHSTQHGVVEGDLGLSPELPTLAERLRAAGYQSIGLYHPGWIDERHGFARGFDVFRAHDEAAQAGEHLFEELARLDARRPWFVFLHLFDVHAGAMPGEQPTIYSAPPPYREWFLPDAAARVAGLNYLDLVRGNVVPTPEQHEALIALYDGGIRQVDAQLETWFERLEREGRLADTLVIVTSDHGEALGPTWKRVTREGLELPVYMHGGAWQEGLHVPLIVRAPGSTAGRRVREPAHLADVAPTVLGLAGLPVADLPGSSLLEPLPAGRVLGGSDAYVEWVMRWPLKVGLLVRQGKCLAVDLERDPHESAVEHVALSRFRELRAGLVPTEGPLAPPIHAGLSSSEREQLEKLGYAGELGDE